jgi:cytochrome P450
MDAKPRCPVTDHDVDLVDPHLYSAGDPHPIWAGLRRHSPVSWHPVGHDLGFWSVVRYADADRVLRDFGSFTSERGTLLSLLGTDDPAGGRQIAVTDPPRHTDMRQRLQKALSAKSVERERELIRSLVVELISPLGDGGSFDFAQAMFGIPMAISGSMMGLPRSDWEWLTRLTAMCIAPDDPEYRTPEGRSATLDTAHRELFAYFQDLVRERRNRLGDDLISVLITTEFEGRRMLPGEILSNCYSLLLGANVTTPHSPATLMAEFAGTAVLDDWSANPELVSTGVEEALRWASPVNHFLRYATRDVELGGVTIKARDAVVVWTGSVNRDEDVFPSAGDFDIRRKPNKHLAFGIGPHYCVGHSVARTGLKVLFAELFSRFTGFSAAGTPERICSNFVSGYKHVPITAKPRPRRSEPVY